MESSTYTFIPRLDSPVSGSCLLVVAKSIRQAKLYQNHRFRAAALAARIGNIFDLCLCVVSLVDIMFTTRPPVDTLSSSGDDFEAKSCIRMRR